MSETEQYRRFKRVFHSGGYVYVLRDERSFGLWDRQRKICDFGWNFTWRKHNRRNRAYRVRAMMAIDGYHNGGMIRADEFMSLCYLYEAKIRQTAYMQLKFMNELTISFDLLRFKLDRKSVRRKEFNQLFYLAEYLMMKSLDDLQAYRLKGHLPEFAVRDRMVR